MVNLVYCELLKLRRSKMVLISFLGALTTPVMLTVEGVKKYYWEPEADITLAGFYNGSFLYTMLLFGLIVYAVFAAYLFSREHTEKTLKTILTVPVSKTSFILSKFVTLFIWIMALTVISWAGMFLLAAIYGALFEISAFSLAVAAGYLGKMLFGGALMFFTLTPIVFIALWTKNVVAPIIATAAIVMVNVALSNEALGALFPWTSTYLWVEGRLEETGFPYPVAIGLIALVSILGFLASVLYFQREDVN
ncbi:ABC transporter permease [Paenibacillus sp. NPDC058071]|uniref:ABC transporter permease n=1 Tax=Paenibacillus sp. NPDC058071 TaxID=3346326 RepID=UPI0036DC94D6